MKYVIVGAPGTGKRKVAEKLEAHLKDSLAIHFIDQDPDLGFLADYREELLLAAQRATYSSSDLIFYHSLIDSMSYTSLRLTGLMNHDPTNQSEIGRWSIVFDACLSMIVDGYKADKTLYIPYQGDDQDSKDLDEALRATLESLKIDHTIIDPDTEVDTWL